ncbi:plasmid stabilization protein [Candidatus Pacearchaeota archaeon CG_4_9_14_0_2_um_filter_39_13]|nr:MAG: plasmid stabilization protein [Candidatus Pacearchaeota archaeon CG_4_9_14_0_2_um_filter_39_13]
MYNIHWEEKALHELEKLDSKVSSRIFKKVESLKEGLHLSDIKRLKNSDYFRLRVGDYRIIFSFEDNTITVWKVGHRNHIYDRI